MKAKQCANCKWYEEFTGACCNGNSEHRADFVDSDKCCKEWEGRSDLHERQGDEDIHKR